MFQLSEVTLTKQPDTKCCWLGCSSEVQGRLIISSGRRQNLKHRSEEQGRGIEEEKRKGSWRMEASSLVAEEQSR